jgi:hypothetical protein
VRCTLALSLCPLHVEGLEERHTEDCAYSGFEVRTSSLGQCSAMGGEVVVSARVIVEPREQVVHPIPSDSARRCEASIVTAVKHLA